ncbi:transmembrane signal receptor [Lithospermum erythrorhizon]|uniref:Transmembrane signal receptor n=1 Tax=Lithospermum erythrorhizon TaxID=34254 RepID=A0AAV3Q6S6_LITER
MSVAEYFGKLQPLWDELAQYNPIPASQDSPPSLDRAYQTMLNQERLNSKSTIDHVRDDIMALSIQTSNGGNSSVDSRPRAHVRCTYCNPTGHVEASCYSKHGFPNQPKASAGRGLLRTPATRPGVAAGRGRRREFWRAGCRPDNTAASKRVSELTDTQWNNLLQILGNSETSSINRLNGKFSVAPWIIDNGASTHVTGNLGLMSNVKSILHCKVGLPNGTMASSNLSGCVSLSSNFVLQNVLYVPQLKYNLMSVSRVTKDLDCILSFTKSGCIVQDRRSMMPIGAGDCQDGLYYFKRVNHFQTLHVHQTVSPQKKGWKLYDLATREFFVSRDVVLYETEFPYINDPCVGSPNPIVSNVPDSVVDFELADGDDTDDQGTAPVSPTPVTDEQGITPVSPMVLSDGGGLDPPGSASALGGDPPTTRQVDPSGNCTTSGDCELGRGHRTKTPSVRLRGFVTNTVEIVSPSSSSASPLPIRSSCSEPKNFKEAMDDPGWREAMHREIRALEDNGIVSDGFHNAFLHGDLTEEVYMKVPPGFSRGRPDKCLSDYSLFTWSKKAVQINVLVYVDDLILSGNNSIVVLSLKEYLSSCFHMKEFGILKYFLGIEVARSQEGIFLSQRKYILNIISEAGLLGAKPAAFPLEQNHRLAKSTSPLLIDTERYRRVVGRLLYLSFTRPDLSFVVHVLSQFLHASRHDHCSVVGVGLVAHSRGVQFQDAILDGLIATSHVFTSEQLTDIFTKALGKRQFEYLLRKLGIHNFHAPT